MLNLSQLKTPRTLCVFRFNLRWNFTYIRWFLSIYKQIYTRLLIFLFDPINSVVTLNLASRIKLYQTPCKLIQIYVRLEFNHLETYLNAQNIQCLTVYITRLIIYVLLNHCKGLHNCILIHMTRLAIAAIIMPPFLT